MISDLLLQALNRLFDVFIRVLPDASPFSDQITTAFNTFANIFNNLDKIFPVTTLFQILGIWILFEIAVFSFGLTNFIFNKVRGSG